MHYTEIHETLAQQIDHVRPDHLRPGIDLGMQVVDPQTVRVVFLGAKRLVDITYDPGSDDYTVTERTPETQSPARGVHADELGRILFGDQANPYTAPLVAISDDDGQTWETLA